MADDDWQHLDNSWQRVKWARERWQKINDQELNATTAAKSLQMEPGTYRAYERAPESSKHISLDHLMAIRFGQKFKVSWIWLLANQGTPFDDQLSENQKRIIRAISGLEEERQKAIADMIITLLGTSPP